MFYIVKFFNKRAKDMDNKAKFMLVITKFPNYGVKLGQQWLETNSNISLENITITTDNISRLSLGCGLGIIRMANIITVSNPTCCEQFLLKMFANTYNVSKTRLLAKILAYDYSDESYNARILANLQRLCGFGLVLVADAKSNNSMFKAVVKLAQQFGAIIDNSLKGCNEALQVLDNQTNLSNNLKIEIVERVNNNPELLHALVSKVSKMSVDTQKRLKINDLDSVIGFEASVSDPWGGNEEHNLLRLIMNGNVSGAGQRFMILTDNDDIMLESFIPYIVEYCSTVAEALCLNSGNFYPTLSKITGNNSNAFMVRRMVVDCENIVARKPNISANHILEQLELMLDDYFSLSFSTDDDDEKLIFDNVEESDRKFGLQIILRLAALFTK
jgi:hypothetical protein